VFVFVAQRTPTEEDTLMAQFDGLSVLGGKPELRSPLTVANRHSQKRGFHNDGGDVERCPMSVCQMSFVCHFGSVIRFAHAMDNL